MLTTHWNAHEHQIQSLTLALRADLEDVSPADLLYGESVGLALGTVIWPVTALILITVAASYDAPEPDPESY